MSQSTLNSVIPAAVGPSEGQKPAGSTHANSQAPRKPALKKGDVVRVTHPRRGRVEARITAMLTPAELPGLALLGAKDAPDADQAREILRSWRIDRVAMISYMANNRSMLFAALGRPDGTWRDLQGDRLTIERAGAAVQHSHRGGVCAGVRNQAS